MENPPPHSHEDPPGTPASAPEQSRRRFFSRRTARAFLIVAAAIAGLLALIWIEENWRGKRAWEAYQREWEAKGERFDRAAFRPKPVPPEENFVATPFLAPLMDFEATQGAFQWRDSNAVRRIQNVAIGRAAEWIGNWQKAEFSDLAAVADELEINAGPPPDEQSDASPARRVLQVLGRHQAVFAELHQAKERPEAVWQNEMDSQASGAVQRFGILKALNQVVILRALAELDDGRTNEALADVELALRLSDSLRSEPLLISYLVRVSLFKAALQPVWEGLARHRWTDAQLGRLEEKLGSIDFLKDYGVTMRGERAFSVDAMAQVRAGRFPGAPAGQPGMRQMLMPTGMFYQNQVAICRMFQEAILPSVDSAKHRVYPEKSRDAALTAILRRRTPYNVFAWLLFPAIQKSAQQAALAQSSVDLARVACALERHRLAEGRYPDSLEALAPRFIASLPPDVISGEPLKYEHAPDGTFVLYSVGWNGADDGGELAVRNNGGLEIGKGDWIWRY